MNIFEKQWLDTVFINRNKAYGAYDLRKNCQKVVKKALIIGVASFLAAFCLPFVAYFFERSSVQKEKVIQTEVTLTLPPKIKTPHTTIKQLKYRIAKRQHYTNRLPVQIDEKKVSVSQLPNNDTVRGKIEEEKTQAYPEKTENKDVSEGSAKPYPFTKVEVLPEFPGGISKLIEFIVKNFSYPTAAREAKLSGKLMVSFIIEKDGSTTSIKILQDIGMGTGDEAIRVLKKMPKWKPGQQRGQPVRVCYTLPLVLTLDAE